MSWTDLFKSRTLKLGKLKPDPLVRWFGKLPTYGDYYRSRAEESWASEFNDWVLKGHEIYQGRLRSSADAGRRQPPRRLPISACGIRLPKSGMTVLASVQDYGGDSEGRKFPLCFYVAIPSVQWVGPTHDRVGGVLRVIRSLHDLQRDVLRFVNAPGSFDSRFGGREIDLAGLDGAAAADESWIAKGRTIQWTEWFSQAVVNSVPEALPNPSAPPSSDSRVVNLRALPPAGAASADVRAAESAAAASESAPPDVNVLACRWLDRVGRLGDVIKRNDRDDFEPVLRFPLAMGLPWEAQVAGWLRWLESRMNLAGRMASLVITGEPGAGRGSLTVVTHELLPEDFLLLSSLAGTLPYLDDCTTPPEKAGERDTTNVELPSTWTQFVTA